MTAEFERSAGAFTVSTDPARLDVTAIHAFLSQHSYWAIGIPRDTVQRAVDNSLCFGLYQEDRQIGLARVITDYATFAYLCDVYVLDEFRGEGLGKFLMRCVMDHPFRNGLRRFMLRTKDAHGLYRQFGFVAAGEPERYMDITHRDVYKTTQ
jgi:GNAT superfamily N-acetyltransferase